MLRCGDQCGPRPGFKISGPATEFYGVEMKTKLMTNNTDRIKHRQLARNSRPSTASNTLDQWSQTKDQDQKVSIELRKQQPRWQKLNALVYLEWQKRHTQLEDQTHSLDHWSCQYFYESWTLTPELERRVPTTEMRCYCRLLGISYKDHISNAEVRN